MEAMFFATPVADGGKIFWCDLISQHYHITKLVFAKNQVVGSVWDHIGPVVHALACSFHPSHLINCVVCLNCVLLWVELYTAQDSINKMRGAVPGGGQIAQCLPTGM
eukprot:6344636-Ditylum_brightwellii.AAC.2